MKRLLQLDCTLRHSIYVLRDSSHKIRISRNAEVILTSQALVEAQTQIEGVTTVAVQPARDTCLSGRLGDTARVLPKLKARRRPDSGSQLCIGNPASKYARASATQSPFERQTSCFAARRQVVDGASPSGTSILQTSRLFSFAFVPLPPSHSIVDPQ